MDRLLAWRDRLLASRRFQRWASRFPLTRPIAKRRTRELFDLCAGFVYAQTLSACVQLRLFEILSDGPGSAADLSGRLGLSVEATDRLLNAAAALDLVERRGLDRFGLGILGAAMLGNPGVAAMVAHHAMLYRDLADPVALLRGEAADTALSGFWPYATGEGPSAEAAVAPYSRLMSLSQPMIADLVLDAYPVARHRTLLDVGGGDGTFLVAASRRAPQLDLVLFDLPPVAALADARFARDGVSRRARAVGGSIFADPLPTGSDLISLVRVVHDHDDGPALAILRAVRAAMPEGGTLLLAEPMAETGGAEKTAAYFAFYLMAMGSGRPRSAAELQALLTRAGFSQIRRRPTANPALVGLIVAKAA